MKNNEFAVNDHFEDFIFNWDCKFYFLVGGYGSSKSYHVATKLLLKLMQEKRKALVIREVYDTIRDSCFSLLKEVALNMDIYERLKFKTSPMKILFPNGSEIIFKGMDKKEKLKSINGISIIWVEECSEVKYEGYKELLGRLRHLTSSNHIICSTNPVSTSNWTYKHFFKDEEAKHYILDDTELYKERIIVKDNTYYHHSIADDNYFLPKDYIKELDDMKYYDPDLYRVARLGHFGVNGTKVLPQFEVMNHEEVMNFVSHCPSRLLKNGMDFGFVTSYNALVRVAIDEANKDLYIYDEYYSRGKTDPQLVEEMQKYKGMLIIADNAEPKTIEYFRQMGFIMLPCTKFAGSRLSNTKKVKRFKHIYCSDKCKNTIRELKDLTYATNKDGELLEDEFNIDPHTFSAIWYALDHYEVTDLKTIDRRKLGI